ncbi:Ig-like domain-containing protein [Paenibacillus sp. MBLB4367]|uniref:Ig-like domain-containing protein n=1 Tax=Paenibacillus sp. MBLB4367 TaxID=3384767 RepID=UPI0039083A9A
MKKTKGLLFFALFLLIFSVSSVVQASGDTEGPKVYAAVGTSNTTIEVLFNEELDQATAEAATNYTIAKITGTATPITVFDAELLSDNKTVKLTISSMEIGNVYQLNVQNVEDTSGNPVNPGNATVMFAGHQ